MAYVDDSIRWNSAASRLVSLNKSDDDAFYTNINVILDEINSLNFGSQIVSDHEEGVQVLSKCCTLVPGNGTNDLLATKFCHMIVNLISRQKVVVNQLVYDSLLEFLTGSIQCCQKWALINHLQALEAVVFENGPKTQKFVSKLLAQSPEGLLTSLIEGAGWDIEVRCKAIACAGHIFNKESAGSCVDEEYIQKAFEIMLNTIRLGPLEKMDELAHYRLVLSALTALQIILTSLGNVRKEYEQPVLAALKNCMFCGLPGYHPKFIKRTDSKLLSSGTYGVHSDDLSSIDLDTVPLRSRAYQNAIALSNKKKKKRQNKNKTYSPQSHTPPKTGIKIRRDYSSVDALMPSFVKTSISAPSQKVPSSSASSLKDVDKNEKTNQNMSDTFGGNEIASGNISDSSGSEALVSAASSDSDFSDSEAGQAARLRSITMKVRQNALNCLQIAVKGLEKKVLFGYWSSFIPDAASGLSWSLFTTILRDPSPKARSGGVAVLMELLDHSRPFLAAADDRDEKSAVLSSRPYTSFSGRLGNTIHEIHRHMLQALLAETSTSTKLQIMKCLSILILNAPYNRLREGVMTRIVNHVRPLLKCEDVKIRVAALTCLGMVISVYAPLNEVIILMKDTQTLHKDNQAAPEAGQLTKDDTAHSDIPEQTNPWLIETCITMVTRQHCKEVQPLAVRIEAIQVLIAFVRNYFDILRPCIESITKLSCECMEDDQGLAVFAIKLVQELGRIMYNYLPGQPESIQSGITIQKQKLFDFWISLLNGSLITVLQGSNVRLITSAIDCLTNIGDQIFEMLPENKRIFFITMLLGFSNDEDKNVKASAVRAVGVLVLYTCLQEDVLYVADTANAVLMCMEDHTLTVRMRAAWSLGNLSDTIMANKASNATAFLQDFSDMLLLKLLELAITASEDHERVKSNAVRALGNFLNYLKPSTLEKRGFSVCITKAVQALVNNISSGFMKVRWNACYAIGKMFSNPALPLGSATWTADVYNTLKKVIQDCKNFKVRINAVISLSVPPERRCYGDVNQFLSIIEVLVKVLDSSRNLTEFSEFKYQENLQEQLCNTLCHLLSLLSNNDLDLLQPILENNQQLLHYITEYITVVLSKSDSEETTCEMFDEKPSDDHFTSTKKTSNADKLAQVQMACRHVHEELQSDHPAIVILRDVLTVKAPEKVTSSPVKND